MVVTWCAVIAVLIGVSAMAGGRHCAVPKRGPFHWLLKNRKFVPTHSRMGCREVK